VQTCTALHINKNTHMPGCIWITVTKSCSIRIHRTRFSIFTKRCQKFSYSISIAYLSPLHVSTRQCPGLQCSRNGCTAVTPDFIGLQYWPPNSANLNQVDYAIWGEGHLHERVYRCRIRDVDRLIWRRFDQRIIDRTVCQGRQRLRSEECEECGH